MDYTIRVLRKCKEYGFKVYIDPHQDTVSIHSSPHLSLQPDPFPALTLILSGLEIAAALEHHTGHLQHVV
jgi:hypothetical protein